MRKSNQFLSFTMITFLFTLSFLIGCSEGERELMFPDTDIPDSVTVTVEDVPEGSVFNLDISTDYRKYKDNLGSIVIDYNYNEKYTVSKNFSKTFPLEVEEPAIAVGLLCTHVGSASKNDLDTIRLIVRFNGDGNFDKGNHNEIHPFEVGTTINVLSTFSRYEGTSQSVSRFTNNSTPPPIRSTN